MKNKGKTRENYQKYKLCKPENNLCKPKRYSRKPKKNLKNVFSTYKNG